MKQKEISSAIIKHQNHFVLQLRDFDKNIDFPGHWGLFGGHLEDKEDSFTALKRELFEELEFLTTNAKLIGTITILENITHLFLVPWCGEVSSFSQHEGIDLGVITLEKVLTGHIFSPKFQKTFPVAPGCLACFRLYLEKRKILDHRIINPPF